MDDLIKRLQEVHLDEDEAKDVAQKLAKGKFSNLERLTLIDEATVKACGITSPFEVKAVLTLASKLTTRLTTRPSASGDEPFDIFLSHIKNRTADGAVKIHELIYSQHPELRIFLDVELGFTLDQLKKQAGSSKIFVAFVCDKYLGRGFCVVELIAAHKGKAELFAINSVFSGEIGLPYSAIIKGLQEKGDAFVLELIDKEQLSHVTKAGYNVEDFAAAVRWLLNFKGIEFHPQSILTARNDELEHLARAILRIPTLQNILNSSFNKGGSVSVAASRSPVVVKAAGPSEADLRSKWSEATRSDNKRKIVEVLEEAVNGRFVILVLELLEAIGGAAWFDDAARASFGQLGACKAVVDALNAFGMKESKVAWYGCAAVGCLVINNNDSNRTELCRVGACKAVVDALNAFGSKEINVAQWGCHAVGNLAFNNDFNRTELGRLGACKAVVDALNAFGVKESKVAEYGCVAVGNLASDESNRTELGRMGAGKAVVDALNAFGMKESKVAENGCHAVGILAANDSNSTELGRMGACKAVVDALNAFGSKESKVAECCCFAVGGLALSNDSNKAELGRVGACKAVVDALNAFGSKESWVAKWGYVAVGSLAISNDSNKAELGRVGACKAVVDALNAFGMKDSKVAEDGCRAVGNLANKNDSNKTELGRLGACKVVVDALNAFGMKESKVAELGCHAVGILARNNDSNKRALQNAGALRAVSSCPESDDKRKALDRLI